MAVHKPAKSIDYDKAATRGKLVMAVIKVLAIVALIWVVWHAPMPAMKDGNLKMTTVGKFLVGSLKSEEPQKHPVSGN